MKASQADAKAVFDLDGATCPSCAYTIEHLGRKLDGVCDIHVDVNSATLEVDYAQASESQVLQGIPEIVRRIGYNASLRKA